MRVVPLHSALGDSRLWRRQVPALAERFAVVAPDLPGEVRPQLLRSCRAPATSSASRRPTR